MSDQNKLFEDAVAAAMATDPGVSEAQPDPVVEVAPTPVLTPESATPAPAPTAAPSPDVDDAVLRRIMDRERQFEEARTAKQRDIDAKAAALAEREAALAEREAVLSTESERFMTDPSGYIRRLAPNIEPERIAEDIWHSGLGDKAPPEYRAQAPGRQALQRILELEAQLKSFRQERDQERADQQRELAVRKLQDDLNAAVGAQPPESSHVARLAKRDADLANRMLLDIAYVHAQQNEGKLPDPKTVTEFAETYLKRVASALGGEAPAPAVTPELKPAAGTISPQTSSLNPPRKAFDPKDKAALRAAAFRAAGLSEVPEEF